MKTVAKLVMLLAVLAICMPAQGEILIYRKTVTYEGAEYNGIDDLYRETIRGFLILDVEYDGDEIVAVDDAIQIEYGRYEGEKWADWDTHDFEIQRFDDGRNILYSLAELSEDGVEDFFALVLQGKARQFSRTVSNEVPTSLIGYGVHNTTEDSVDMCRFNLRLIRGFTNDANEGEGMSIVEVYDEIRDWLNDRDYPLGPLPS